MLGKGTTVSEAAHKWVGEFSRFPHSMIETLVRNDFDSWTELTLPTVGDRVYVYSDGKQGEITQIEDGTYTIETYSDEKIECKVDEFEVDRDGFLPMWGTLWQFGDSCDDYWLSEDDGIKVMSECGFRVYEHDEWGYFFGIDGAGYDFYESHWIPAYRKRGLQWHDPETEVE